MRSGGRSVRLAFSLLSTVILLVAVACGYAAGNRQSSPHPNRPSTVAIQSLVHLDFVTPERGWAVARLSTTNGSSDAYGVLRTVDAGAVWTVVQRFTVPTSSAWDMSGDGSQTAVLLTAVPTNQGSLLTVWGTTDGGRRWVSSQATTSVAPGFLQTCWANQGTVYALLSTPPTLGGVSSVLYEVHNAATLSRISSFQVNGLFPSGCSVSGARIWITGQNVSTHPDEFLVSNNNGQLWVTQSVALNIGTNADTWPVVGSPSQAPAMPVISYLKSGAGFDLYHEPSDGTFVSSTPLRIGVGPPATSPGATPVYSAVSPQLVWVLGRHSLYETVNGGRTWRVRSRHQPAWQEFQFVNSRVGWAIKSGSAANLWYTRDGGTKWMNETFRVETNSG